MGVAKHGSPVFVSASRNGDGLFAARPFSRGENITRIDGRIVHHGLLWKRQGSRFSANCFRFGPETYLDPGEGPGAFLNHSCEPNAGIRKVAGRLFLFAAKSIRARREVVIDYSTTIGDDDIWSMRCNCGSGECRGTIRNFGSLSEGLKRKYLAMGMVPGYILRTLTERLAQRA
jgi:hypothetical protein